ncbi:MAG: extracellular solute-binding protein [Hyphomicrobiaceae bacterium]|nr:extracellular solute-binding protein [Hyphomicrobiaceae bacterium]
MLRPLLSIAARFNPALTALCSATICTVLLTPAAAQNPPPSGRPETAPPAAAAPATATPAPPQATPSGPAGAAPTAQQEQAKPPAATASKKEPDANTGNQAQPAAAAAAKPVVPARLRVVSWSGAYGRAQEIAVMQPLRERQGFKFRESRRASGVTFSGTADVVEVDQETLLAGCASGRFVRISGLALKPAPDGKPATEDFLPGALSDCGVGTFAWSALFLVDGEQFSKRSPRSIEQIFDARRYPGKRALLPLAPYVVTMAALASGIKATELREKLAMRAGADAVFARLEAMRKHIVWAATPQAALDLIDNQKVAVAMSFSGRVFRRTIAGHLTAMWDGNVYDFASWAVPSTSKRQADAKSFIAAATAPELLAAQATHWPYGPMRSSAITLAPRHARVDIALAPYLPTEPSRLKAGVRLDPSFWAEHGGYYERRLKNFREGIKFGIKIPLPGSARRNASDRPQSPNGRRAIDG